MSSPTDQGGRPDPATLGFLGDEVGVGGELLEDLAARYANYRHALAGPFDPVKTLMLTGDVLESVNTILTAIGQAPGQRRTTPGKAGQ